MERLDERAAVVTGAASGIGLAIAARLAACGVRVLMTDVNAQSVLEVAGEVRAQGGQVEAMALDVGDAEAVERAAARAVDVFGGLHIAVCSAGIVNRGYTWELSLQEWHRVLDINLWGVIHGVRSFVPRILKTGEEGHVVNIASMAAVLPQERLGPYTVAKHGVLGLSDVLRADLSAKEAPVGVSVVMPGRIRTGMNPMGTVEPGVVADRVMEAIRLNVPYVFTDDHSAEEVEARLRAIMRARADVPHSG